MGPNLPAPRGYHCMVALENQNIMILGGSRTPNKKSVLIFDTQDSTFSTGPSLLYERDDAGCTVFHRYCTRAYKVCS